jgi:hypothetical protein
MVTSPGFRDQEQYRTAFRVGGALVLALGVTLTVIAGMAFADTVSSDSMDGPPGRFFLAFAGLPLIGIGGWLLQAGFLGAAARYTAGETAPVLRDTASYLSDGEGILGVGRSVDDKPSKYCSSCGKPAGDDARFCESCGHAFA